MQIISRFSCFVSENGEKGRNRIWNFLKDLEVDMKDWINGVDLEVPDIIRRAGYQVGNKV